MRRVSRRYYVFVEVTILVCLPIEFGCCSMSTDITEPSHTKSKATQVDYKLSALRSLHEEFEKSAYEENGRKLENEPIQLESRKKKYDTLCVWSVHTHIAVTLCG